MTSTRNAMQPSLCRWLRVVRCQKAVGTCVRKLLMVCYGVLKNRAQFDPVRPGLAVANRQLATRYLIRAPVMPPGQATPGLERTRWAQLNRYGGPSAYREVRSVSVNTW